jgi:hypothetical protein
LFRVSGQAPAVPEGYVAPHDWEGGGLTRDPEQFNESKPEPWGYLHSPWRQFPEDYRTQGTRPEVPINYRRNAPQSDGEQSAMNTAGPLAASNWQTPNQGKRIRLDSSIGSDLSVQMLSLATT